MDGLRANKSQILFFYPGIFSYISLVIKNQTHMETLALKTPHAEYDVIIQRKRYSNGRLALEIIDVEDGCPVMMATVNIPEANLKPDEVIIKNYSENEGMLDFLLRNGIVEKPHRYENSGFVRVPVCKIIEQQ